MISQNNWLFRKLRMDWYCSVNFIMYLNHSWFSNCWSNSNNLFCMVIFTHDCYFILMMQLMPYPPTAIITCHGHGFSAQVLEWQMRSCPFVLHQTQNRWTTKSKLSPLYYVPSFAAIPAFLSLLEAYRHIASVGESGHPINVVAIAFILAIRIPFSSKLRKPCEIHSFFYENCRWRW